LVIVFARKLMTICLLSTPSENAGSELATEHVEARDAAERLSYVSVRDNPFSLRERQKIGQLREEAIDG